MKRAALVLATSVALLLSGVSVSAHAATRKYVSMPSDGQVIGSGNGSSRSGDTLHVPGDGKTEYIPSSYGGGSRGTKLPVKVRYDYSIPRTIKGMAGRLRGGVPGMALTIGLEYMLDQVDGYLDDAGKVRVPSVQTIPGGYYWVYGTDPEQHLTAPSACSVRWGLSYVSTYYKGQGYDDYSGDIAFVSADQAECRLRRDGQLTGANFGIVQRKGSSCPVGSSYNASTGGCETATGSRLAEDSDYDLMEAAAAAKDSEWLKDRLREHCEGGLNPQACYESLRDSVKLEGPSIVTEQGPTSTTTSPAGTTTTTSSTKIDITYGDNYYDYRKTKTTIVTKPDGTTETTTETEPDTEEPKEEQPEDMPAVTDLYKSYIDKLNDIKTDVSAPPAVVSPIGWSAWYSFGGGCSEITAELPIIGSWSTNYCPYIYDWVRPILAFIFVVFTWHYCRELWSEAVTQARPM